jgi:hypothetical protein
MPRLKDIKQEILEQHRQLAFNRRELGLRRLRLVMQFRSSLHSRGALLGAFAIGLLLGWRTSRPPRRGGSPTAKGLRTLGHWLIPFKSALWSGLVRTATDYMRPSGEPHEYRDR